MPPETDTDFLVHARSATLATLAEALRGARDVALLDVPNQRNVGDALILAGQLAYLEELGVRIRYVSDLHFFDPDRLRSAMPTGTVLLHGGGNLGDLWPGHQDYREEVVRTLHDYPVVQLPQSIYFQDRRRAANADRVLGSHPDLLLLLREPASQDRAQTQLPNVRQAFCHDMALGHRPRPSDPDRTRDVLLVLARQDKERAHDLPAIARPLAGRLETRVTDWAPEGVLGTAWRAARTTARFSGRVERRLGPGGTSTAVNRLTRHALWTINRAAVAGGTAVYRDAAVALVDRLHAHVLAGLLGVEHVVLDNSYGKVGAVYEAYTHGFRTAHFASSEDEAQEILASLVHASA